MLPKKTNLNYFENWAIFVDFNLLNVTQIIKKGGYMQPLEDIAITLRVWLMVSFYYRENFLNIEIY